MVLLKEDAISDMDTGQEGWKSHSVDATFAFAILTSHLLFFSTVLECS